MGKFKVGDKAKLIADNNGYGLAGDVVTILHVLDDGDADCEFEYEIRGGRSWFVHTCNLVAVAPQPQLTIQAGRYYKTRDGRKVGPIEDNGSGRYYWRSPDDHDKLSGYMAFWCEDGAYYPYRKDFHLDLIAEWVDEPVADAPAKFKVGDRVVHDGHTAILREILDDGRFLPYLIEFESDVGYGHNGNYIGKVRLTSNRGWWVENITAAPAPSAIVALIENGQPRPSANPFIHPDRDAATKEAKRLAGKHKGQEFGVYELVGTVKEAKVYEHEWQRLAAKDKAGAISTLKRQAGITTAQARRIVYDYAA